MYISAEDITTINTNINTILSSYTQFIFHLYNSINSLKSKCYKFKMITNIDNFLLVMLIFFSLV